MHYSKDTMRLLTSASDLAGVMRHEFVTPEHLLYILSTTYKPFMDALGVLKVRADLLAASAKEYLNHYFEVIPEGRDYELYSSSALHEVCKLAESMADNAGGTTVDITHVISALCSHKNCDAGQMFKDAIGGQVSVFMSVLLDAMNITPAPDDDELDPLDPLVQFGDIIGPDENGYKFFGRKKELDKITRILCRYNYNNVMLVGDHGVGKSTIIGELARLSAAKKLPKRFNGKTFFDVNVSLLMMGTEMRGALERNIAALMTKVTEIGNMVLVFENFAAMFSSGSSSSKEDPLTALTNYLTDFNFPIIAIATHDEMKRIRQKGSAFDTLFEVVEIPEMSEEDTVKIVRTKINDYFEFHNVNHSTDLSEYIVDLSIKHMPGTLPSKALRLTDDIGAWGESHAKSFKKPLEKSDLDKIVSEITGRAISGGTEEALNGLADRIKKSIFGQDKAVDALCTSLLIAKAGLSNPAKPLGSFLFIGPTGVGKTQLAKTLSEELSQPLVRFDMSEYAEKHTVSKFIGSPAGYVGYDDGGLLTDAVRKNPGCVLLLDEIEKAHQDIYNLLLQIMDYGTLTDSKGQKADFRGVVLIMTSNAGARFASHAGIGYGKTPQPGSVMEGEAKKVFAPEFLNRLSSVVVFNGLDQKMASSVLDAKIDDLVQKLKSRDVRLSVSAEATAALLKEGFSAEYGAREIERVIDSRIKPILVQEILFGSLKNGGKAVIEYGEAEGYSVRTVLPKSKKS